MRALPRVQLFARSRWLWLVGLFALVAATYIFIGSAGHPRSWPVYMTYYDLMAEGFRSGHLYIPTSPSRELLSKANPYDPANSKLWFWDVTLHRGRYYMYWGPVPGILQALAKSAIDIRGMIGDQYLVSAGFSLSAMFGGLLVERSGRLLFNFVPRWLRALAVLALAFANPAPHLLASGGVYQAAIGFGQAFALAGLFFGFEAVWRAPSLSSSRYLLLAGGMWALAIGSRVSLVPTVGLFGMLTALAVAWPSRARVPALLRAGALVGAPMLLGFLLLLSYNYLRFQHWLDFGTDKQLSTLMFRFSPKYLLTNLYSYSLRPFVPDCKFPYAMAPWWMSSAAFPAGMKVPEGYLINEPVVGWLRVVPLTWMLVVVPFVAIQRLRLMRRASEFRQYAPELDARARTFLWCAACFVVLATVTGIAVLGLYMSTMRYLGDVTNGLVLLGALGLFALYSWSSGWLRTSVGVVGALMSLTTIAFGLLLGYQGYTGHFKTYNPQLDSELVAALSVCEGPSKASPAAPRARQKRAKR